MADVSQKISLELVPRSFESLFTEAKCAAGYERITHINVPDLKRFPISSRSAVSFLEKEFPGRFKYIPHLVGRDLAGEETKHCGPALLVSGDEFTDTPLLVRDTPKLLCLISGTKYVALDQYRGKQEEEIQYLRTKMKYGAAGIFTQPFFSLTEVIAWEKILPKRLDVFFGISPVVSEGSKTYWETKNKVIFPKRFTLSFDQNVSLAKEIISWTMEKRRGVYLMPIRVPVKDYLAGIFE